MHLWHQPADVDDDTWDAQVEILRELCDIEDVDNIWSWFHEHYPWLMKLVPSRRKTTFVSGVLDVSEEGSI